MVCSQCMRFEECTKAPILILQAYAVGGFSSIHLLGLFSTTAFRLLLAPFSYSPSAKRPVLLRSGHGKTSDAATVMTDARAVRPNRYETNVRRWPGVSRNARDTAIVNCYINPAQKFRLSKSSLEVERRTKTLSSP